MFIGFPTCSFKCCKEGNFPIEWCQNCELAKAPNVEISAEQIVRRFVNNKITSAMVIGGMEPFDSWEDLKVLVQTLRTHTDDDCVVYTGYNQDEIQDKIEWLKQFPDVIIKFGRFIVNDKPVFDNVLGVTLASSNQKAEKIS